MQKVIKDKRDRLFQDKNYVDHNVEKVTVWNQIQAFNMNQKCISNKLDVEYARKKRLLSEKKLRQHKIEDVNRWETFRKDRDELYKKKKQMMTEFARTCHYHAVRKAIYISKVLSSNMQQAIQRRDFKLKKIWYCSQL